MDDRCWQDLASSQAGMLAVSQLTGSGVPREVRRHKLRSGRWVQRSNNVISTTTGELSKPQRMWLGVLHAGPGSLIGGLSAADLHGLRNWPRDDVTVLVDDELSFERVPGVQFFRTRRPLADLADGSRRSLPVCRLEPAVLLFGGYDRSSRTARGVLAAVVQQRLCSPDSLAFWVERLRPLRRAKIFRQALREIEGGAQSVAEMDVRRMCRSFGLVPPTRQTPRSDRGGRRRYTDCEWELLDGHVVVLEVDGAFHYEVSHYDADMKRQRKLTSRATSVLRCGAAELREDPASVAEDLIALGVPQSCAEVVARTTLSAHDRLST